MATKFPIEMVTSLTKAKANSPLVWNGSDLLVSMDDRFNLQTLSDSLSGLIGDFSTFKEVHLPRLEAIPGLQTQYNEINPKVAALLGQVETVAKTLSDVVSDVRSYAGRLGPLEIKIGDMVTEMTTLLTLISEVKSEHVGLASRIQYLEDEGSLAARVGILESIGSELRNRIEPVETDLATAVSNINTMLNQISAAEARLNIVESNIGTLQSQLT